jgi:uncharacterized repeat protein (TIGR01451 family)
LLAGEAYAEGVFGGKTFGQRLDDFGRTIFGTNSSEKDSQPAKPSTQTAPEDFESDDSEFESPPPRAGSNSGSNKAGYRTSSAAQQNSRSAGSQSPITVRPNQPPSGNSSLMEEEGIPDSATARPGQSGNRTRVVAPNNQPLSSQNLPAEPPVSEFGPPPSQPIQNRLMQSRSSAFNFKTADSQGKTPSSEAAGAESQSAPNSVSPTRVKSPVVESNDAGRTPTSRPSAGMADSAPRQPTPAKRPGSAEQSNRPVIAQRTTPVVRGEGGNATPTAKNPPARTAATAQPPVNTPNTPAKPKDDGLLFTRRGPVLSVETLGPRKIIVGKESTYAVVLTNSGEVGADELVVFVNLPDWAEVTGAETSNGTTQIAIPGQAGAPFQWKVGHMEAKAKEKLTLKIIPRQSKPFDLAVRWDYKPLASQAMIEVQEPRLEMKLEGPRDVFYGKKETYRLRLMNSGTGSAEGVSVKLQPVGTGENVPATYQLGILPAGEERSIEIELTARQAGELGIQVEAKGDAGIHAELSEKVLVRRAGLDVLVDGPKLQYVGTAGTYTVRVRNPGNAPARNIHFIATLPAGMKYVGGIEGLRADAGGKLQWILESLNPQLEQVFTLKCNVGSAGAARLDVAVSADDELSTAASVNTQVDVVANLQLEVQEPSGPMALNDEAMYEIRIRNRGTKEAEGVEVLSYFSRGIEPTSAEGGPNRIGPGQVAFAPIASLAPGAEAVFKVRAKAETAGNHVFRAEVHCKAMGTRLISEKNTLYYEESVSQTVPDPRNNAEANNLVAPEVYRTQRR